MRKASYIFRTWHYNPVLECYISTSAHLTTLTGFNLLLAQIPFRRSSSRKYSSRAIFGLPNYFPCKKPQFTPLFVYSRSYLCINMQSNLLIFSETKAIFLKSLHQFFSFLFQFNNFLFPRLFTKLSLIILPMSFFIIQSLF